MKVNVKTLKGKVHEIEINDDAKVSDLKSIIQSTVSELSNGTLKLIHSGKILSDDSASYSSLAIPSDAFIVCMVTKPRKTPSAAAAEAKPAESSTPSSATSKTAAKPSTNESIHNTLPRIAESAPQPEINPTAVSHLVDMGFPEDMVRAALRASQGNPDVAVEFLMNGLPDEIQNLSSSNESTSNSQSGTQAGSQNGRLARLRQLPEFNALRRMTQSNPGFLQQVLESIGQQDPELLNDIHANQAEFIAMMNEPVHDEPNSSTAPSMGLQGVDNPAAFSQMLMNMDQETQTRMAARMGLNPEQLRQMAEVIGHMPPEQLQQLFSGVGESANRSTQGQQVVRLTEDESNAVNRLMELGFTQNDAVQAYMACDKDEALAANYLMDNVSDIHDYTDSAQPRSNNERSQDQPPPSGQDEQDESRGGNTQS
mmetsp:Transcript_3280/g.5086  ORF Transcript_3280/g.5086 Transcript_3280/m.5086 type:complete len:426 (+) Transcript_3280:44-1321(+)